MSTERQLDYVSDQLARLEATAVDPERFGRLTAEVESLRRDVEQQNRALSVHMDKTDKILTQIQETLSEARGGWRTLMLVGGAASMLGGALVWIMSHFKYTP